MSGMPVYIFNLLFLVTIGMLIAGLLAKKPEIKLSLVGLAGLFLILTGGLLIGEGIRDTADPTITIIDAPHGIDANTTQIDFNYPALRSDSVSGVGMIGNLFMYGGFAVLIYSAGYALYSRIKK